MTQDQLNIINEIETLRLRVAKLRCALSFLRGNCCCGSGMAMCCNTGPDRALEMLLEDDKLEDIHA
jgi:hypothetical protein